MRIRLLCIAFALSLAAHTASGLETPQLTELKPAQQQSQAARLAAALLTRFHYKAMPLDDAMSEKIFDHYLKSLDSEKFFFVQADIDQWSGARTQLDDAILNPGALLERLNSDLLNEDLEKHVSMFYGVLNRSKNLLRFSNGGQFPSPFLWSAQGVEVLREQGAAVGLFPFARYGTYEKRLPARFLLAIFSDGVLDILPQPTLQHKLAFLRSLGSDSGIGRFMSVVQTNAQPPDDVTILSIKREGAQHGD